MSKLPNWVDCYPQGTKEGDEELKFFIALTRNPKYQWRSTSAIAKESGLSRERVEQIVQKYFKKGMIFAHPKNDDHWAYHARVPDMIPKDKKSISDKDQEDRINKITSKGSATIACDPLLGEPESAIITFSAPSEPSGCVNSTLCASEDVYFYGI